MAGYVGTPEQLYAKGTALLQNENVMEAIRERSKYLAKTREAVASREERQEFFSAIMRNRDPHHIPEVDEFGKVKPVQNIPMNQRLKAGEMLSKMEGDFSENLNINGQVTVTDIVLEAYKIKNEEVDAIEAEYKKIFGELDDEAPAPTPQEEGDGDVHMPVPELRTDDSESRPTTGAHAFI